MRGLSSLSTAAAIGVALVMPASSGAQAPTQDSVTGAATSRFCGGVFTIDARSGRSGENPVGDVTCGTLFSGPVTCLNVMDNVALVTVQTEGFGPVGLIVTDLGATGDTLFVRLGPGCPTLGMFFGDFEISGDLVVVTRSRSRPRESSATTVAGRPSVRSRARATASAS